MSTERLCAVSDLEVGSAMRFVLGEHKICLVRGTEGFFAIDDTCSHEDYSLAAGEVDLEQCAIECWKHGSLFSLLSGEPMTLPATRPVAVYEVLVENGDVSVKLQ